MPSRRDLAPDRQGYPSQHMGLSDLAGLANHRRRGIPWSQPRSGRADGQCDLGYPDDQIYGTKFINWGSGRMEA